MKKTNVPIVTLAIFMTTFMTAIEGTIVSTAMPTIVSDLDGLEIMNWVISIFLLMTAVSTPLYGKLADSIGPEASFFVWNCIVCHRLIAVWTCTKYGGAYLIQSNSGIGFWRGSASCHHHYCGFICSAKKSENVRS